MKARVKATGSIIEVVPYSGFDDYDYYEPETRLPWYKSQLEFDLTNHCSDPDYWARLEHQYTGMAMQGLLTNSNLIKILRDENVTITERTHVFSEWARMYAHALVEKMKEERE